MPVPAAALRRVVRTLPTGVTVLTTSGRAGRRGMTATSFTSVSNRPPLISVCLRAESRTLAMIAVNGVFAVNVLGAGQEPLLWAFAAPARGDDADAFADVRHRTAATGAP